MSKAPIALACALAVVPGSVATAQHDHGNQRDDIAAARQATVKFKNFKRAKRAGYVRASECVPGMGVHFVKPELAEDRQLDVRRPEILVYQRRQGRMRLVALEYFLADADQRLDTDDDRPRLFDQWFDGPMEGHEPGMPIHYDLHVWLYRHNPYGLFTAYNWRVSC